MIILNKNKINSFRNIENLLITINNWMMRYFILISARKNIIIIQLISS